MQYLCGSLAGLVIVLWLGFLLFQREIMASPLFGWGDVEDFPEWLQINDEKKVKK